MIDGRKRKILIICEGLEEKIYIDKLLSFPNIKTDFYSFVPTVNVKGNTNIVAKYQYEIQSNFYDAVLVFCDGDNGSKQFKQIVHGIGEFFFSKKEDALNVLIFANPVTMQIILSHFGDANLKNVGKKTNAKIVEKMTGVKYYDAKQDQIEHIVEQIHFKNLPQFKERLNKLPTDIDKTPSTNFLLFLDRFEKDDGGWIDEINSLRK